MFIHVARGSVLVLATNEGTKDLPSGLPTCVLLGVGI